MMGWPHGWVSDQNVTRTEQLQILGNGVVPQQAATAIRYLLTARNQNAVIKPTQNKVLVDASSAAIALKISPTTIKNWQQRGHIHTVGRDSQGRSLYDLNQVQQHAEQKIALKAIR
jgi:hypothetical protein